MLVLIKTPTITFSLEVQPDDSLDVLYSKVSERTNNKRYQFQLTFAGDVLSKGTLGASGIKKESTIHMILIKEIKITISYLEKEYSVEIPNNSGLKISHLVRQIRTSLASQIPAVSSYSNTIQLYKNDNSKRLTENLDLQENITNYDTVLMTIVLPPTPPPFRSTTTTTTTTKSSKFMSKHNNNNYSGSYKSYDSSSEESSSDDEGKSKSMLEYKRELNREISKINKPDYSAVDKLLKKRNDLDDQSRIQEERIAREQEKMADDNLLKSFVESSMSSDVQVVFCFDTTGSMVTIIQSVRTQIVQTVNRLMKDIPNIQIGIMGMGDYCDGPNVLKILDLSSNVDEIVQFINSVPSTSGGDAPEAYEYALYKAKELSWKSHTSKAFVMIGDCNPHEPSYTNLSINWFKECDDLYEMGIKIYGVRALGDSIFYDDIAQRTGGICINFKKFNLITEMFLAICYREASKDQFDKYQDELKENEEMNEILQDLNRDNFTVVTSKEEELQTKKEEDQIDEASSSAAASTTTTTTTTTTTNDTKKSNIIFKEYGKPSYIKVNEPWYNINPDIKTNPAYLYNPHIGYFENYRVGKKAAAAVVTSSTISAASMADDKSSTSSADTKEGNLYKLFDFETKPASITASENKKGGGLEKNIYIMGDSAIGKTTFINNLNYVGKTYNSKLRFKEKSMMSVQDFESCDLFIVCFTLSGSSYNNFTNYFTEIRKRDPLKPIAIAVLKTDLPGEHKSSYQPIAIQQLYSLAGTIEFNSKLTDSQVKSIEKNIGSKLNSKSSKSCILM